MGNSVAPSLIQEGEFLRLASKFRIIKYDTDRHCLQVVERRTQQEYIFKQITIRSSQEKEWFEWLCREKKSHQCENLLKINAFGFQRDKGSAQSLYKGYFLFDKPFKDLKTEMATRQNSKIGFADAELLIVMEGVVRALKLLKSLSQSHGAVCTTNILVSKNGTILLSDPWLNPEINAYYRHKNRVYFSPERLNHQNSNQNDWFTSDLFSLGMSILQLIFSASMEDVYLKHDGIDFKSLLAKTMKIKNLKLRRYVQGLIHPTQSKRVLVANQIDSQTKIVSVTLRNNNDFLISRNQHTSKYQKLPDPIFPETRRPLKLFQKYQIKQPKHQGSSSLFKTIQRKSPQIQYNRQILDFKKKKPTNIPLANKQNRVPHQIVYSASSRKMIPKHSQFTPVKEYSTLYDYSHTGKSPLSQLTPNYSTNRLLDFPSKFPLRSRSGSGAMKKCSTQRSEEFRSNILTSDFHCHTEMEERDNYISIAKVRANYASEIGNPKRQDYPNQYLTPRDIFPPIASDNDQYSQMKKSEIEQRFVIFLNKTEPKQFKSLKAKNPLKELKLDSNAESKGKVKRNFRKRVEIKEESKEESKEAAETNFIVSKLELISPSSSSTSNDCPSLNLDQPLISSRLEQSQEVLCQFNNSKTHTFSKLLQPNKSPADSPKKEQTLPPHKQKLRRLSFIKPQILQQQMTPKKQKQVNTKNSTIRQESESGISSGTINPKEFVIEESSGGRYQGYKQDGYKNGEGKLYYDDGGFYDGEWKDDCMHGFGKLYYNDEGFLAYQGQFFANQFHGKGKVYNDQVVELDMEFDYSNFEEIGEYWVSYEGYFQCDMKNGIGKLRLSNGEVFEGQFKDDAMEGEGRYYTKNGELIMGVWRDSRLVEVIE